MVFNHAFRMVGTADAYNWLTIASLRNLVIPKKIGLTLVWIQDKTSKTQAHTWKTRATTIIGATKCCKVWQQIGQALVRSETVAYSLGNRVWEIQGPRE